MYKQIISRTFTQTKPHKTGPQRKILHPHEAPPPGIRLPVQPVDPPRLNDLNPGPADRPAFSQRPQPPPHHHPQ